MDTNILKDTRKHFSSIGMRLFIGTLIIYAVRFIAIGIINVLAPKVPVLAQNGSLVFILTMFPMYVIAFPIIFLMFKKIAVHQAEKKKMSVKHLIMVFLICYAFMHAGNFFGIFVTNIIGMLKQGQVSNVMGEVTSSISLGANFFIAVICAPIMEELLFRKVLMDRTLQYGEGISVALSGLLFALFHGNLNQFVYAFLLGIFFAFVYAKTRDVKYSMILHMAINFMGSFASTIVMRLSGYDKIYEAALAGATEAELTVLMTENAAGIMGYCAFVVFILVCMVAGIVLFIKDRKKFVLEAGEISLGKAGFFKAVLGNVGIMLFSLFWIVMIIMQLMA